VNCVGGAQQSLKAYEGRKSSGAYSQKRIRGIETKTQGTEA
jgi:hypothetical protein